tara:strand:- start:229 stop:1026 length:798 start_codon:yes stop_codon:yes gene_type:complete
MPLWVKPNEKVSVKDMMNFMRDHLEGTELDMSKDFGAGPNAVPYRWRPLTWKVDGVQYCNERATATQQTAFSFVSQSRDWLPDEIGGIIWWGLDDASSTVYTPLYSSMTRAPKTFAQGNGALMEWSDNSAFWVFSQVANYAYTRYNLIHPEVEKLQSKFEAHFIKTVPAIDAAALKVLEQDRELALHILTSYSVDVADNLTMKWKKFYQYLFMKYHDGNMRIKKEVPEGYKYVNPDISYPGYSKEFYEKLVKETGDKLKVVGGDH